MPALLVARWRRSSSRRRPLPWVEQERMAALVDHVHNHISHSRRRTSVGRHLFSSPCCPVAIPSHRVERWWDTTGGDGRGSSRVVAADRLAVGDRFTSSRRAERVDNRDEPDPNQGDRRSAKWSVNRRLMRSHERVSGVHLKGNRRYRPSATTCSDGDGGTSVALLENSMAPSGRLLRFFSRELSRLWLTQQRCCRFVTDPRCSVT